MPNPIILSHQWQHRSGVRLTYRAGAAHWRSYHLLKLLAILAVLSLLPAVARAELPDEFNPGANGAVRAFALQPDSKILVGGSFSQLGGQPRSGIGRLNPDGTLDITFSPGVSGAFSLALQPDGKILVGCCEPSNFLSRLNTDGALDSSFNPVTGANGFGTSSVTAIALQPDGKIVVGGNFSMLNGQPRNRIARLNPNGTLDTTFNAETNSGFALVSAIALEADGKIVVGGDFYQLGGQTRINIGRLNPNGTLDTAFNPGAGTGGSKVRELAVQSDGKIVVGGAFAQLGGQPRNNIGRLNANGTLDETFDPGAGANGRLDALAVQADGKILVGGNFSQLGGQPRNLIGRFNTDGALDDTFNPGASGFVVEALAVQADGKILVGGQFSALGGQPRNNIGRLSTAISINAISQSGNTVTITLDSITGYSYQLQRSLSSLDPAAFSDIGGPQAGSTGSELTFTDSDAADATAFYRVTAGL